MRERGAIAGGHEFVPGSVDWEKLGARGNEPQRGGQFFEGAEAVASTVNEQRGGAQVWKMRGAELRWPFRRMQRVGEQKQSVGEVGFGSGED